MPCPSHLTPGNDPVPTVQEVGWAPGPVWRREENLPPLGFDPDCPAHSKSLYKLCYTNLHVINYIKK